MVVKQAHVHIISNHFYSPHFFIVAGISCRVMSWVRNVPPIDKNVSNWGVYITSLSSNPDENHSTPFCQNEEITGKSGHFIALTISTQSVFTSKRKVSKMSFVSSIVVRQLYSKESNLLSKKVQVHIRLTLPSKDKIKNYFECDYDYWHWQTTLKLVKV